MLNNMLEFYYSTMQGGKSTALLQRRHNLISIGKRVLVLTSSLDDRYGVGKVTSRMGPQCEAQLFTHATVFDSSLPLNGIDEVFIDEAQFLRAEQVHQIHANLTARVKLLVASVMRPMAAYLRGARPQRRPSRVPG